MDENFETVKVSKSEKTYIKNTKERADFRDMQRQNLINAIRDLKTLMNDNAYFEFYNVDQDGTSVTRYATSNNLMPHMKFKSKTFTPPLSLISTATITRPSFIFPPSILPPDENKVRQRQRKEEKKKRRLGLNIKCGKI